jgi:hypothetical protein
VSTSPLHTLPDKARLAAEVQIADDEHAITVIEGRGKQALIVTDRQLVLVKHGLLAGVGRGVRVAGFALAEIEAINVYTGPKIAALEIVAPNYPASAKADLSEAFRRPNWLPCDRSLTGSALIGELRTFVQSEGRSRSARAALTGR